MTMLSTTSNHAKSWLENISSKDSVAIINDVDSDGMCSGVLMSEYLKKKKISHKNFFFYRGISELKDFDLKNFNKVILLDLGKNMLIPQKDLIKGKDSLFIDHHNITPESLGENILEYTSTAEICTSRLVYELVGGKEFLMINGVM